jgi:protein gp37
LNEDGIPLRFTRTLTRLQLKQEQSIPSLRVLSFPNSNTGFQALHRVQRFCPDSTNNLNCSKERPAFLAACFIAPIFVCAIVKSYHTIMSEKTNIKWADSTWNPWSGCTKVSPGCANCYAEARDARMMQEKVIHWGKGAPRLKSKGAIKDAFAMNRQPWICDNCGEANPSHFTKQFPEPACPPYCLECNEGKLHRRRIFSLSLGDWLDDEVPIEWLAEMLDTIRRCDQVIWILCTKRPDNFNARLCDVCDWLSDRQTNPEFKSYNWIADWADGSEIPSNIILLASVENQAMAALRIPQLLAIPAACRGLSLEPLLGPVSISQGLYHKEISKKFPKQAAQRLNWLIIGGESGPGARACNVDWIRALVETGKTSGVATFVKQLGANIEGGKWPKAEREFSNFGRCDWSNIQNKKGGDPNEWPADLRIQQWPAGY